MEDNSLVTSFISRLIDRDVGGTLYRNETFLWENHFHIHLERWRMVLLGIVW